MDLISHLDLLRLLERALRRCALPVTYSEGFHPLPRLQIALALPLGVEGFGEWMDIDFYESIEPEIIKAKLQEVLPKGIKLINANVIPIKAHSLSQELASAIWSFNLTSIKEPAPSKLELQTAIDSILGSEELIWKDVNKKGRPRMRNFRQQLSSLQILISQETQSELHYLQRVRLQLNTLIDPIGRSIKPIQIKYWLEKYLGQSLEISDVKRDEIQLLQC